MRWLLLDEVVSIEKGLKARTKSRVIRLQASPEILMVEMMAQTGALLLGVERDFKEDVVFAKMDYARFRKRVQEQEPLDIEASSDDLKPEGAWLNSFIYGLSGLIAESRFLLMNVGHLAGHHEGSITFHEAFMNHLRIRDKVIS